MAGTIFLDSDNYAVFSDDKNIIYGHNMKDGSMFHGLRIFLDDEFLKEHHILYLYLPDEGVWIFVIVKCEYTPADGDAFLLERRKKFRRFCFLPVEQMPPNVWPYGVKGRKRKVGR